MERLCERPRTPWVVLHKLFHIKTAMSDVTTAPSRNTDLGEKRCTLLKNSDIELGILFLTGNGSKKTCRAPSHNDNSVVIISIHSNYHRLFINNLIQG